MNLHIIGVARALVDGNECVAVDSIADAERIILSNVHQPDTNHDIDDNIRELSESNGNGAVCGLIGAPEGGYHHSPLPPGQDMIQSQVLHPRITSTILLAGACTPLLQPMTRRTTISFIRQLQEPNRCH